MNEIKDITMKRIKGLLEAFIGGERSITPNHIIGQMKSAVVKRGIITAKECQKIIEEIEESIKTNKLYPTVPKNEKLERLKAVMDELQKADWWQKCM